MITINVKSALICVLFIAVIVLVIYLIIIAKNLVDAAVISKIAAEKTVQVESIVDDVQAAVSDLSKAVRGEQNLVSTLSNIIKALGPMIAFLRKDDDEKTASAKKCK